MTALENAHVEAIGRFAAGTHLDDVPDEVVGFARLLLVDTLGALLGGLRYPPVQELARTVTDGAEAGPHVAHGPAVHRHGERRRERERRGEQERPAQLRRGALAREDAGKCCRGGPVHAVGMHARPQG